MTPQEGQTYLGPGNKPATVIRIADGWITCRYNSGSFTFAERDAAKWLRPQSNPTSP